MEVSTAAGEVDEPTEQPEQTAEPSEPNEPDEQSERLAAIEAAVAEFNRRSAHREAVIDRLHEENQRLRDGVHRAILEPVIADLLRLYDSMLREAARLAADAADPAQGRLLESFADDTLLTLERCGLDEFTADPGDPFDPGRHAAVSVVAVDDEALDNTVAEVVATGFVERETGRVRRPLRARFHRFAPPAPNAPDAEADAEPSDQSETSAETETPAETSAEAPARAD
ncbi:nucleotide exchange factor GrpE [Actinomadura sp. 1N219]|uniref:nucleotide exchange factor GrpE n=1 Tax=Actinomadura sp. 1N219 TaxID=3375152 RepID=UPI00378C5235